MQRRRHHPYRPRPRHTLAHSFIPNTYLNYTNDDTLLTSHIHATHAFINMTQTATHPLTKMRSTLTDRQQATASDAPLQPALTQAKTLRNTEDVSLPHKIVFSGLSGAIATTCIYPLDLIKTKLQNQRTHPAALSSTAATHTLNGPLDAARKVWAEGGVKAMFRGWPPNVILVMPEKALKLTMNDFFRANFRSLRVNHDLPVSLEMAAGGLAGFTQVIATNPMELLKIQGATMSEKLRSGQLTQRIPYSTLIRGLGVTGLYTGVLATLVRDVPFSVIYFSLYAYMKRTLLGQTETGESINGKTNTDNQPKTLGIKPFLAGAVAGTLAAAISCPMDVIKTRVHANAVAEPVPLSTFFSRECRLLRHHTTAIIREEGYRALAKGLVPRCLIISPLFAITMACYEAFQQRFG